MLWRDAKNLCGSVEYKTTKAPEHLELVGDLNFCRANESFVSCKKRFREPPD